MSCYRKLSISGAYYATTHFEDVVYINICRSSSTFQCQCRIYINHRKVD